MGVIPLSNEDMCYAPAVTLADQIRRKALSPVELVDAFLDRIDAVNPRSTPIV